MQCVNARQVVAVVNPNCVMTTKVSRLQNSYIYINGCNIIFNNTQDNIGKRWVITFGHSAQSTTMMASSSLEN
jgi:hypothetical protein